MVSCCPREGIEREFGARVARWDLRRYRRRGPSRTTRMLIDALLSALRAEGATDASVLDIGGGVGAIHHALLDAGAREAVEVEVSPDYLAAAREEAERRGHAGRVRFVRGDFVTVAADLDAADVVTLDRVICCYPDMERLVAGSAAKAQRLYGAVYPRQVWWVRVALTAVNALMRLRRSPFRVYLHPPTAIEAVLRAHGLDQRVARRTVAWTVAVYARRAARPATACQR